MQEYECLGNIQKLDSEIDELLDKRANLPEEQEFESLKTQLAESKKARTEKQTVLTSEKSAQKKIEDELELLDSKIKHEDGKLYSGTIANPKELKGIQQEVVLLRTKKDKIETELLELLDRVDNMNSEADESESRVRELTEAVKKAEKKYQKVAKEIEEKVQDLKGKKEVLNAKTAPSLITLYESIRKKKKQAAVVIADGVCQGCFVELPAEEVDKMLGSDELWRCPQCRRILLR